MTSSYNNFRPLLLLDDKSSNDRLSSAIKKFDDAVQLNTNLNAMGDAVYEVLAIAVPHVCIREEILASDQQEFLDGARSGFELIHQDVLERNQHVGQTARELARSFVQPLVFFIGLFAELIENAALNARLPAMRTVLVVQATHHLAADWDLAPEVLLAEVEYLAAAVDSYDLGAMSRAVLEFRDAVIVPHTDTNFDLSVSEDDPLKRYSDAEIAEIKASMVLGYGRPSVPRFADGPRLARLQERIDAIIADVSVEPHRLEELQKAVSDIEQHRANLAYLDDQARKGLIGFIPSDSQSA